MYLKRELPMAIWIILAPFCIVALISLKCHARSSLLIIKDNSVVGNLASCNMIVMTAVSRNNLQQQFVSQVHAPWLFSLLTFMLWRLSLFAIFKYSFTRLFSVSDFYKTPSKTKTKTIQHRYLGIWEIKRKSHMHASGQDSGLRGSFIREIDISGIFTGETFYPNL